MSTKLHYFNSSGLAEAIRLMLHHAGEEFEDIKHDFLNWPNKSIKDTLPYGQLPKYEEGNRSLTQSIAIARYVGTKAKLVPSDPWEQALLDAVVHNIYDFYKNVVPYIIEKDPTKRQDLKKKILEESLDYYFSRFEKELKENKGFFGGKLSWADFVLFGIIESTNLFLNVQAEKAYPAIQTLIDYIKSLPRVKEYLAARKPYVPF